MTTTTSSTSTTLDYLTDDLILTGTDNINGTGNARNNTITGNSGANVLNGMGGTNTMIGGAGDDTYVVDSSSDVVVEQAGEGTDTVQSSATYTLSDNVENLVLTGGGATTGTGNGLDNTITGNAGANTLNGGGGNDTLAGNGGNDVLDGGAGADDMQGGVGDDTYIVDQAGDNVLEAAGAGSDTVKSGISYTLGDNVENLTLTGTDALDGTGNALDNVLTGNGAGNNLSGGAGNDLLNGGAGADRMIGGSGNDIYVVDDNGDQVIEALDAGTDTVQSSISTTLSDNVENLVLTGTAAINGSGNELDNNITGNSAANVLNGGAGNDKLDGGAGADIMNGGTGDDTYVVDNTGDVVVENAGEGTDKVLSSVNHTLNANVENLTLTGGGDISGTGNELDNTITGNTGNNTLNGGAGNDILTDNAGNDFLDGGTGADTMAAGTGSDTYVVDNAGDLVIEAAGAGTDTTRSSIDYTLTDNVENLVLTGTADLAGTGNALNNVITGNGGNNTIDAAAGNDTVNAGGGDDLVHGGDGADLLNGEAGNDALFGDAGNDRIDGGTGADRMDGGTGDDTYVVDDNGDLVNEDAGAGIDLVESSITYTLTSNVENLTLTGTANIDGTGNDLDNVINGNGGNNVLSGLAGNDTLNGNAGTDTLLGGEGKDLLNGGTGADIMEGGTGDDVYIVDNTGDLVTELAGEGTDRVESSVTYKLTDNVENLTLTGGAVIDGTGNELDNTIVGNTNSNVLSGGLGNDTLIDTGGNDRLDGGEGADNMAGGSGNDTYVVDNAGDLVTEAQGNGLDTVESSIDYTLTANVENLVLTGTADLAGNGNALNNVITGNSGNNTVDAGAGSDTVNAGAGNDVVSGGDGNDFLYGEAGNDQLAGDAGNDRVDGGTGADQMAGGLGDDTYVVDDNGDIVTEAAGAGTDLVESGITYTLTANVENLNLTGTADINGAGNDLNNIINGNTGANVLDGLGGNDIINAGAGSDILNGGDGNDQLNGDAGDDILNGDAGNDNLNGGIGNDVMRGGSGDDTYIVDSTGDVTIENAGEGLDTVQASVSYQLAAEVENLVLTGNGNTTGTGNELDNVITGNGGNNLLSGGLGADTLDGGAGSDTLDGGSGADKLSGGIGNDTYIVDNAGDVVIEAAGAGSDTVESSIDYTLGANLENLTLTGGALNGTGNALANSITGNAADNLIDGGAGVDTMAGGAGDDTYIVDATADTVVEAAGAGIDTVRASATYTLSANVENLILTGSAAINGTGNALDNNITGNDANNVLSGGAGKDTILGGGGNDIIDGGSGADTMAGGTGNDSYIVDDAADTVVENAGEGVDVVQASISYKLAANVENLSLLGNAAIDGSGNELDNIITGNAGSNVLSGDAGNDILTGGAGADLLQGGSGNDTYRFGRGDGLDRVVDAEGSDTLALTGGLTQADLVATRSGNDLVLTIKGSSDSVTLTNWVTQGEGVNRVVFDNGSMLDRAGMIRLLPDTPAIGDHLAAREDGGPVQAAVADLLANDGNPAAQLVSLSATSALGAQVTLANGAVQYELGGRFQELAQGEVVKDSFSYTVRDDLGRTSTATVEVAVTGVNDGPVAAADSAAYDEAKASAVKGNVLANDTDADHGTVLQVARPGSIAGAFGVLTLEKDGSYSYTLNPAGSYDPSKAVDGVLTEHFGYEATDGIASSAASLEIQVKLANRAPVAAADLALVAEDGPAASGNVLVNDRDPDAGNVLSVAAPGSFAGAYGTLVLAKDGSYTYTLNNGDARVQALAEGQKLAEHFDFDVTDSILKVGSALDIAIVGTNDAPVVKADAAALLEDGVLAASGNVLANDSDVDAGNVLSVAAPGSFAGAYGTLVLAADGSYTYTLNNGDARVQALAEGQKVIEHFDFDVSDSLVKVGSILDFAIVGANDAPVVTADAAALFEDGVLAASGNVLANDSDADAGAVLKVAAPGTYEGSYGTLVLAADGSYTYQLHNGDAKVQALAQGQSVVDSFGYGATDGTATTASTLAFTVTGSNDKPVLKADTAAILANQAKVTGNVLLNDSDIDNGASLSVKAGSFTGKYGTLALNADGSYAYSLDTTAAAVKALGRGATAIEHFDYTGTDGFEALLSSLDIKVTGTNDAPVLLKTMADLHINFNKSFWFQLPGGVFADADKGDTLVYSATLANGAALPSWLKFDAATGAFSGTAPKSVSSFDVRLTATDKATGAGANLSVSDVFKLYVDHGNNGGGNGVDAAPNGQFTDKDTPPTTDTLWLLQSGASGTGQQSGGGAHLVDIGIDLNVPLVGVQQLHAYVAW
jgi:VCBS repeat-containing protein